MVFQTASTPPVLAKYREAHTISVIRDWDPDLERMIDRCAFCLIRVFPRRGGMVHDASRIKDLARMERGG